MYLAEVAPARIRGRLVTYWLAPSGNWRWMFAAQVIPSCALLFGLLLAPESPRWLVEKGRQPEALRIMTRISGSREAEREIEAISRSLAVPGETGRMSEL